GVSSALLRYMGIALGRHDDAEAGDSIAVAFRIQTLVVAVSIAALGTLIAVAVSRPERLVALLAWSTVPLGLLMSIPTAVNGVEERFDRNVISWLIAAIVELAIVVTVLITGGGLVGLAASLA